MCPTIRIDTSAVTNVAVTPAAKPFGVIVGYNTFEGVAMNLTVAILYSFYYYEVSGIANLANRIAI